MDRLKWALIGAVTCLLIILAVQRGQPWYGCINRPGYVYVVDSRACLPLGALTPAVHPR